MLLKNVDFYCYGFYNILINGWFFKIKLQNHDLKDYKCGMKSLQKWNKMNRKYYKVSFRKALIQKSESTKKTDLVKFIMCTLVSRVHMTFYILTKGCRYTFPENQGT